MPFLTGNFHFQKKTLFGLTLHFLLDRNNFFFGLFFQNKFRFFVFFEIYYLPKNQDLSRGLPGPDFFINNLHPPDNLDDLLPKESRPDRQHNLRHF